MKRIVPLLLGGAMLFLTHSSSAADANADLKVGLYADMKTSQGNILLRLEYEKVPLTVANFVGLAEGKLKTSSRSGQPFYDGLTFHRVLQNFMIQGGAPEGNGQGGPGYQFADEFDRSLKHDGPGVLSMANAGPDSNGSQFFITHKATPHLDNRHSVFGRVVKGQDVVNAIKQGDKIEKVTIVRVGDKAKGFEADQETFDELKKKGSKALKEGEAFREANKKKEGVKETASGLQYKFLKSGTGTKPKATDNVSVHYRGTLIDGTEFDSSYKRGEPSTFPLNRVIPGWTEGLQLMSEGDKAQFVIPPSLGNGERGAGQTIPPNATLIFEVELIKVN